MLVFHTILFDIIFKNVAIFTTETSFTKVLIYFNILKNFMKTENKKEEIKEKTNTELYVQLGIIAILALVIVFNIGRIYSAPKSIESTGLATGIESVSASGIIPKGTPAVYGAELGVKYDYITPSNPGLTEATISKLSQYEDMELNSEQMQRYIRIGGSIACEYCCGAKSLIFSNGERACGCAHSYAMRGLAKYLLTKHPNEFTDDEVLEELGKWKTLFFPGQIQAKAQILSQQGIELNYINLASNKYRGIEQGLGSGQMVGGC